MRKLLLLAIALLAAYMASRALRRQGETITLLWALIGLTATASTPNTAKTRAIEDRVNTVVAAVGTAHGIATGASAAATAAQGSANTAQSLANNAQGAANNANANAGTRVSKSGDTVNGNLTVQGQMHSSTALVDGTLTADTVIATGNATVQGQMHAVSVLVDSLLTVSGQRIAPGQGTPSWYPQGGAPANSVIATELNSIIGGLRAAGIFT